MLKFLRERGLTASYDALLAESNVKIEDDIVKNLYQAVHSGDFVAAECVLGKAASAGLYTSYLASCEPTAAWTQLHGADPDGNVPGARGGHAMCIDTQRGLIYIHGGFNGTASLDDFWVYAIAEDRWRLLSSHTGLDGGPSPRSCHRMVVDDSTGDVYLLGRLSDNDAALCTAITAGGEDAPAPIPSSQPVDQSFGPELWCYRASGAHAGSWECALNPTPDHV